MKPIKVELSNVCYRGPTADIGDLWVGRVSPGIVEAVYQLDEDDRRIIADGGMISIQIFQEPMPPISLAVVHPNTAGYSPTGEEHHFKNIPELDDPERNG